MKKPKLLILAAAVSGLAGGGVEVAEAASSKAKASSSKDAQIEALTRRLELLERRLEESENRNLQSAATQPAASKAADAESPAVKQLDQKVKVIERKLEVDKEVADAAKKTAPKFEVGSSGFKWSSADDAFQLRIRGFLQADGDFFMDDSETSTNKGYPLGSTNSGTGQDVDRFTIRRSRLQVGGTLWKYADFLIAPDFSNGGTVSLFDGYVDLHYFPFASLTAGKQKAPVELERLQAAPALTFTERAYPTQLAPNRDIGIMLHGEFAKPGYSTQYAGPHSFNDFITYQVGVFNGTADNQSPANSNTANWDHKDFEGRVFAHPFQHSGISPLEGFGLGLAGTYGSPQNQQPLPNLVSPGQSTILSYQNTSTQSAITTPSGDAVSAVTTSTVASANGDRTRIAPQAYWYWGPFGLMGEWINSTQELDGLRTDSTLVPGRSRPVVTIRDSANINQSNTAWQVTGSYVLTGEDNGFQTIKPRHPFNPFDGNWGALQLVARWHELDIDKDTFKNYGTAARPVYLFSDPRNSVQHATSWGVGANWWLNNNLKIMADYEQTYFEGGATNAARTAVLNRQDEKVFFTRFQVAF